MAIGSGLGSQLMYAEESVVGTEVIPTRAIEFLSESLTYDITWLDGSALKAGQTFKRVGRTSQSRFSVSGDFNVEALDKGLGLLLKHAMGATSGPTQIATSGAYRQIHTPGDKTGLGLTIQVGRPQPNGTVRAHTYRGCKIVGWEFSCSDNEIGTWKFDLDGWHESVSTALAVASYATNMTPFTFADSEAFTLGGTAATASGLMTVTGGVAVATLVKGITISAETPLATERYGLGNSGVKREQIQNDWSGITIEFDGEYTDRVELYDVMLANTTKSLEVAFTHGDAGGGNPFKLGFIFPAVKIKEAAPNVGGPDIVEQSTSLEAYDDESGTNSPMQIEYVSTDATLV